MLLNLAEITMGLKDGDPRLQSIISIVQSAEGLKAAVLATSKGLPALAGVDPLLREAMGADYTREEGVTMNAAWFVVQQMRDMGFRDAGTGRLPDGCVAKVATKFIMLANNSDAA